MGKEKIIIKHYPSSFRETELLDYLRTRNITDLVICGMMTHMCIDATVRAAKGIMVSASPWIGDACATRNLEINGQTVKAEKSEKLLAALNYFYAMVKATGDYLKVK